MSRYPAPAKINLHLHITGRTAQGYHLLDTSFAYVDACDILHIAPAPQLHVSCSDPSLNGANNLVFQVLQALREKYRISGGLHVLIEKHLPAQAGLGGGSSDAATALIVANALWELGLSNQELCRFALHFGADIPCFLFGGASLAQGIGEHLSPLSLPVEEQHVVLAHPGEGLSTSEVFAHFDREYGLLPDRSMPAELASAQLTTAQLTQMGAKVTIPTAWRDGAVQRLPVGENMLEDISVSMCPELARLLSEMRSIQPSSWMSGSGTACVALCENADQAKSMAGHLAGAGLAAWTHAGKLLACHPLYDSNE